MAFIKKFVVAFIAIALILGGGAGTQSSSMMLQGGGFIGLIVGLIVLYIFAKMAWRAMGCLPSFLIFAGIIIFVLYAIGAFNNGVDGVGATLKSFLGQSQSSSPQNPMAQQQAGQQAQPQSQSQDLYIGEHFSEADVNADYVVPDLLGAKNQQQPQQQQPQQYAQQQPQPQVPTLNAPAEVISADTLKINGRYFRLFGIDAPELNQTCADLRGRSYNCGSKAREWLKGWIANYPVNCVVMQQASNGTLIGTCSLGDYDLGAALVNAGWAVAYRAHTDVYVPYEQQAKKNKQGLWRGQFYMPWDWRELQAKKPDIKVIKPKTKKRGLFG